MTGWSPTYHENTPGEHEAAQVTLDIEKQHKIKMGIRSEVLHRIDEQIFNSLTIGIYNNNAVLIDKKGDGNLYAYSEKNGVELLSGIYPILQEVDASIHAKEAGYELQDLKIFKYGKEVSPYTKDGKVNPDFIIAVTNINFYQELWIYSGIKKNIENSGKLDGELQYIERATAAGVLRIKDILYFYGKGYIAEEHITKLLQRTIQELPNQCRDMRLYHNSKGVRMGLEVTKQELDEYLNPTQGQALITEQMHKSCLKVIEQRDRLLQQQKEIQTQVSLDIAIERSKNEVLAQIQSIINLTT